MRTRGNIGFVPILLWLFAFDLLFVGVFFPGAEQGNCAELSELESRVHKFTLTNGVRVLFVQRRVAPVFAGQVWVKVGGVDERPGITGIAHFLEHMAFKGTKVVGTRDYQLEAPLLERLERIVDENDGVVPENEEVAQLYGELRKLWVDNEFSQIYARAGSNRLNAMTAKDYTAYVVRLPAVAFELWCRMEADRLINPVFRQFYQEREVVLEERRSGFDDNPSGRLYELLLQTAFISHPQRLPVIGYREDLERITASQMRDFYNIHYHAENIVVALVGDLTLEQVRSFTQRHFGAVPQKKGGNSPEPAAEPVQQVERKATLKADAEPQVYLGWHKPTLPDPSDAHFAVLHSLLSDGRSSRLYANLVDREKIALSASSSEAPGERYPNLFIITAVPAPGVSLETVVSRVQQELDSLLINPPSMGELAEAKKRSRLSFLKLMDSDSGLAQALAKNEAIHGDWRVLIRLYDLIEETTLSDLQNLVRRFLQPANRTVVSIEKKGQ
jgi:predicted Zn-dependent peptidase